MARKYRPSGLLLFAVPVVFCLAFVLAVGTRGAAQDASGAVVATTTVVTPTAVPVAGPVLVLPIRAEIESGLAFFVARMIRYAEQKNCAAIVFEINSPGGLVTAAQEIRDAIKNTKIRTVAFVHERALSAAALIAIACEKIAMKPGSEMGAATPISLIGGGAEAAPQKFVSAFKAEFETTANFRSRPPAFAAAMVDKDHPTIPGLVRQGEILTFTTEKASEHGYCDAVANSVEQVLKKLAIDASSLEYAQPTSAENIARWLTNPNISVLLFSAGVWIIIADVLFLGASTGLLLVGGALLALFFGGHLFAYLAGWEAIILFAIGIGFLFAEVFVVPGSVAVGIVGITCTGLGMVLVFGGVNMAMWAILKFLALSTVATVACYMLAPHMRLFDHLILKEELTTDAGFVATPVNPHAHLMGVEGFALTPLHPAGYARLGSARVEVVSEGEFIERDDRVVVVQVEGDKIVVRKL